MYFLTKAVCTKLNGCISAAGLSEQRSLTLSAGLLIGMVIIIQFVQNINGGEQPGRSSPIGLKRLG